VSAAGSSSPAPDLFAERLRASLPAPAAAGTVLQCGMPPASTPVEAVEGTAPLLPVRERQAEATGAEPPLPGAPKGTASARKRYRRRREGHPHQIFFRAPATGRAAMRSSTGVGGRPYSGFVPRPAATLCSAFGSGRGAGAHGGGGRDKGTTPAEPGILCGDESLPISSRHIALGLSVSLSSGCAPRGGRGSEARQSDRRFVLSSSS
jgi:hypothetical protein